MTCAAEIGGVAICLQLLSGLPYRLLIPLAVVGAGRRLLGAPVRVDRAGLRLPGPLPARLRRRGDQAAPGLGPGRPRLRPGHHSGGSLSVYLYFVVGLLGAAMTPYEVYFYSSGAVEDGWGLKELGLNKVTSIIGYGLGGFLSFALMIVAGALFLPQGIDPQFLGTPALAAAHALGQVGPAARARRDPVRRRRRGDRDVLLRRVQHGAVLRLALGQEGAARRGVALHALRGS